MNTTTTKIAGEAMTDEQIAHLWDCSEREGETILDGYAREIRFARALLASTAAVPEGWKLVPVELNADMLAALRAPVGSTEQRYRAMLAASPVPPTE
jgi:hypothetical protein